ncbi:family 43 glycosylhydrolase [Granulicella sibirica]|uniref:Alpha-L-arabinofuranosidase II n=1 Tax=Granulicella sibirica TaxID=2479048 RepID=A0A4Q0T5N4_9BACT|nr:glycoside hydrolase family 43 protein [Granulicella sibirica]RXH56891.1 Alpha-L-arabinofuranosidase II precursor [Granulicella sibirica]
MKLEALVLLFLLVVFSVSSSGSAQRTLDGGTFTNPLLPVGPDPWVVTHDGFYYYMNTMGSNLTIWKTKDLGDLAHAEKKKVWTPPAGDAYNHDIWAPELHRWNDKWYIYYAADMGKNESHRIFVLENASADPLEGTWTARGKVGDATDKWAIDASVFDVNGTQYLLWSGWEGDQDGEQRIYLARLKNPWTVDSQRMVVSFPKYPWEHVGDLLDRPDTPHVNVNEGPEALVHDGKVFVVYSGSACWTDYYELGVVEADVDSDLLKPESWKKFDHPFFKQDAEANVFGPGHNGFFKSLDGKEDWIIFHANPGKNEGCGNMRSPRMQRFTWNADGTPDFGKPVAAGVPLKKPSH